MPGAGQLNTKINILRPVDEKNQESGETETTFQEYHRLVPAHREDVSGGTTRRGLQVEATVGTVFMIPWISEAKGEIGRQWQVQVTNEDDEGPIYDIVKISQLDDRNQWLFLYCSAVV